MVKKEKEVEKAEQQPDYKTFIAELRARDRWTHEGIEWLLNKYGI